MFVFMVDILSSFNYSLHDTIMQTTISSYFCCTFCQFLQYGNQYITMLQKYSRCTEHQMPPLTNLYLKH